MRTAFARAVAPGERARASRSRVRGPIPPGRYRLAFDLVEEGRAWFAEVGNVPLEAQVDVLPRIERARSPCGRRPGRARRPEEPVVPEHEAEAVAELAPGVVPAPDWSRRSSTRTRRATRVVAGAVAVEGGRSRADGWRGARAVASRAAAASRASRTARSARRSLVGLELERAPEVAGLPAARSRREATSPGSTTARIVVTSSTAIRSSTRVKTNAPRRERDDARRRTR